MRYALAAASFGAGLIHATAVFDHFGHHAVVTFFILLAAAQVGWAAAVLRRPIPSLLRAGAVLSAAVVGIWIASRTTGLPGVPGAEEPESFGLRDGVASTLEAFLVAGVGSQFVARTQGLRLASGRLASGLAIWAIGLLTAAGLAAPGDGHHHDGAAYHRSESTASGDRGHEEDGHGSGAGTGSDHHAAAADLATSAHTHAAGTPGRHEDGHAHEAGPSHAHTGGHDHASPSVALAAGVAGGGAEEHDHNAPGHVHDPSHHHAPGHVHDPAHHHDQSGHQEPSSAPAQESGAGHDHGDGGGHHDGGGHDGHEACSSPFPENQAVTTLQEAARSTLGAGCHIEAFSPTSDPHRHSKLHRSAEHFIS